MNVFFYVALSYSETGKIKVLLNKYNLSQGHLVSSYFIAESTDQYRLSLVQPISRGEFIVAGQVQSKTELKLWHMRIDSLLVKNGTLTTAFPIQSKSSAVANMLVDITAVHENVQSQKLLFSANVYSVDAADRACIYLPELQIEVSNAKTPSRVIPTLPFPSAVYDVYKSNDKAERSGKISIIKSQTFSEYFQITKQKEVCVVPIGIKVNSVTYFCSKTETKKQKQQYYQISQTGAVTQKKLLETVDLVQSPKTHFFSSYKIVVCKQSADDLYVASLYNW